VPAATGTGRFPEPAYFETLHDETQMYIYIDRLEDPGSRQQLESGKLSLLRGENELGDN
jgi:hypothetical protein